MSNGISCVLCEMFICKYLLDFRTCDGIYVNRKPICKDCAKKIAMELIEDN